MFVYRQRVQQEQPVSCCVLAGCTIEATYILMYMYHRRVQQKQPIDICMSAGEVYSRESIYKFV
jgi:hypothetical protein